MLFKENISLFVGSLALGHHYITSFTPSNVVFLSLRVPPCIDHQTIT